MQAGRGILLLSPEMSTLKKNFFHFTKKVKDRHFIRSTRTRSRGSLLVMAFIRGCFRAAEAILHHGAKLESGEQSVSGNDSPRLVFFHPLRGLKIPRAFSPTN